MKNLVSLENELGVDFVWGSDSAPSNNVQPGTANKIRRHVENGFDIYVGNNPGMDSAEKWENYTLVRLSMINSRTHGKCIRTIWAAKAK